MSEFKKPSAYKSLNSTSILEETVAEYEYREEDTGNVAWLVQNLKTLFVKNSQN